MGKGIRELRSRIRGVKNIAQITRAMEMVATTKLRRLQERAEGSKPYASALKTLVGRLAGRVSEEDFPLLQRRPGGAVGVLAVTADKGLCGAYNSNVFRLVQAFARERGEREIRLHVFGSRGAVFFARRQPLLAEAYRDSMEKIPFVRVRDVVRGLARRFVLGEIGELHIVSTRFHSVGRQVAEARVLLPIDPAALLEGVEDAAAAGLWDPILEPTSKAIFDRLLPKYLEVQVYGAILEALASEFAMRRVAMKAATDAANDMINGLTRQCNRARQETITKELLEIIGGAEALRG
ncbi:MAG: ATP synthase F1 subunit gamma [Planctomycetes bacterium]|nr:ATP synthase F1 subunit gamma [Planctomycetota bacterium]